MLNSPLPDDLDPKFPPISAKISFSNSSSLQKMENSDIVNVILAAKHLEINELFLVGCKAVAKMFEVTMEFMK